MYVVIHYPSKSLGFSQPHDSYVCFTTHLFNFVDNFSTAVGSIQQLIKAVMLYNGGQPPFGQLEPNN